MKNSFSSSIFFIAFLAATFGLTASWLAQPAKVANAQSLFCKKNSEPLPANAFIELAKVANPIVVNISTSTTPRQMRYRGGGGGNNGMPRDPFFDMFEQFMGPQPQQQEAQQALGTGFVIRKDGLILTNNHVVEAADVIQVQLAEGEKTLYQAKVIGRDSRTDVALIKIDPKKDLVAAKFGSSKNLEVGEWVAAFGNPFGHGHSMTTGIVSAIGREINEINRLPFIQTDASINPGNSGGPLLNTCGEVVGINAAIDGRAQGIGFAIPIDEVKALLPALEKEGSIKRAYLGVRFYPQAIDPRAIAELNLPTDKGALIVGVEPNSPAGKAGLKEYDFITKFGKTEIETGDSFRRAIEDAVSGNTYSLEFYREGKKRSAQVTLNASENVAGKDRREKTKPMFPGAKQAPYGLGFKVAMLTPQVASSMGIMMNRSAPVITEVDPKTPAGRAGLRPGDIVVDVNRQSLEKDSDVVRLLKPSMVNSMRVFRGQLPVLIYIEAK